MTILQNITRHKIKMMLDEMKIQIHLKYFLFLGKLHAQFEQLPHMSAIGFSKLTYEI